MDCVPVDWKLVSSVITEINGRTQKFSLFYDVAKRYLDNLPYIGFIGRLYYGKASVARIKTIVPPNEDNNAVLDRCLQYSTHLIHGFFETIAYKEIAGFLEINKNIVI